MKVFSDTWAKSSSPVTSVNNNMERMISAGTGLHPCFLFQGRSETGGQRPNLKVLYSLKVPFDFDIWGAGVCRQKRSILNLSIFDVAQTEGQEKN